MTTSQRARAIGAIAALFAVFVGGTAGFAQDAPATPGPVGVETTQLAGQLAFPARIHAGTCLGPGAVAFPLSDIGIPASAGATTAPGGTAGPETAIPAYVGTTLLEVPLDRLLSAPHTVIVHDPAALDDPARFIACGDIGGIRYGDTIQFGLGQLNKSGYTGVALISGSPDGSANVSVYLSPNGREDAAVATPAS